MITLNCDRIEPAAKKKDKECLTAGLTIGRRKLQLKINVSFALYFSLSLLINFMFHGLFFLHEQRVSLRPALSVLSDIIISRNELSFYFLYFFIYLFIPFSLH